MLVSPRNETERPLSSRASRGLYNNCKSPTAACFLDSPLDLPERRSLYMSPSNTNHLRFFNRCNK